MRPRVSLDADGGPGDARRERPRIALNALALRPDGTGVSTYIRELLHTLPDAVDADLVAAVQEDVLTELPARVTARPMPVAAGVRRALSGTRALGPANLVHGLDTVLPLRGRVPSVVTVHDLSVFDVPWTFSRRRAAGKRWQLRRAIRAADAVISVSTFTAERVEARFGRESTVVLEAAPSDVAPPPAGAVEEVRRRYSLPERFVLHVGTIEPRKAVGTLAEACAAAGVPLVLAGGTSPRSANEAIRARRLGYVPRPDLLALYGAATVVAYPSLYEGFGLPPLEAMACGAAVVSSDSSSLPEALGDGALLVGAGDVTAWTDALRSLFADGARRDELAANGHAHAARRTWHEVARETASVYRSLGVGR